MRYLIILDNGEEYSDHTHQPILDCSTRAEAEKAMDRWYAWRNEQLQKVGEGEEPVDNPPFGPKINEWNYCLRTNYGDDVSILPCPTIYDRRKP